MKICYLGFYDKNFSKNVILIRGLRKNKCYVFEKHFEPLDKFKYFKIIFFLILNSRKFDVIFCAYPSYVPSILASLISKLLFGVPVCLDATTTYEEQEITSRNKYNFLHPKGYIIRIIDWLAFHLNSIVFVESKSQKKFCLLKFGLRPEKIGVIYFGADENKFNNPSYDKDSNVIFFRGKAMNEVGFDLILGAFRDVQEKYPKIIFNMFVAGDKKITLDMINLSKKLKIKNLYISDVFLSQEEIIPHMKKALVSLGQFTSNPRINKTVPYKAYESMALGLPYITAESDAVKEVMSNNLNCIFTCCDSSDSIRDAIIRMVEDRDFAESMSKNNIGNFRSRFVSHKIGESLVNDLEKVVKKDKK